MVKFTTIARLAVCFLLITAANAQFFGGFGGYGGYGMMGYGVGYGMGYGLGFGGLGLGGLGGYGMYGMGGLGMCCGYGGFFGKRSINPKDYPAVTTNGNELDN
ncbi:hypothetical protein Tcan_15978 [Toxocara canis]|uniref:Uncharacterized protein n=2 Tax=Toxocara canis TaxID=6265 RepID=A0A0B2W4G8_TOXCA|nr:hypothetical protein Tcan_15978 [Toxocara canis]VDM38140.1 unnamed protein product [Toxocara canis]